MTKPLTLDELREYEKKCDIELLCLSDSDYDDTPEDADINEQLFFKNLDNGFVNYDSDNDDEIVKEYNDTESFDSSIALSDTSLGKDNKYDSDNEEINALNSQLKNVKPKTVNKKN